VIFVIPELIENNTTSSVCINKCEEDSLIQNKSNHFNSGMSQNVPNTNRHTNEILYDICNSDKSTNSCLSFNNNCTTKIPSIEKHDGLLNSISMTNENKSNIDNTPSSLYYTQEMKKYMNQNLADNSNSTNKLINRREDIFLGNNDKHSEVVASKLENCEHLLDSSKCNRKPQQLSWSVNMNDDCKKDDNNIQLNSFINDSNLSESGVVKVKNYCKPIRLNVVTTEPYPKYTPTVEKAIKKYEDKQPKKECIVM